MPIIMMATLMTRCMKKIDLEREFVLVCVHHRPIELAPCAAQKEEPLVARLIRKTVQLHELANQSNSAIDIVQVHVMKVTPIEDSTNVYGQSGDVVGIIAHHGSHPSSSGLFFDARREKLPSV